MTQITLIPSRDNDKLAAMMRADLEASGMTVVDTVQPGAETLTLFVLSPQSANDRDTQSSVIAALDNYQHVLPVTVSKVDLPRMIDNLEPLDFSGGYDRDALLERVAYLTGPDAPRPLVTLTPSVRGANQRALIVMGGVVLVAFFAAVFGVIVGAFVPPADEFAGIETQIYLTRNHFIDGWLPQSTDDALAFEATIESVEESIEGTVVPYLRATATGISIFSESTHYPRSTEDAVDFPLTVTRVSTLVQERLAATVTELAATSAAITPTPMPDITTTPDAP